MCVFGHLGAELLVEQQLSLEGQDKPKVHPNVFLVGATWQRLLTGAEDLGLFKEFQDGTMRGFTYANRESFKEFQGKESRWRWSLRPF